MIEVKAARKTLDGPRALGAEAVSLVYESPLATDDDLLQMVERPKSKAANNQQGVFMSAAMCARRRSSGDPTPHYRACWGRGATTRYCHSGLSTHALRLGIGILTSTQVGSNSTVVGGVNFRSLFLLGSQHGGLDMCRPCGQGRPNHGRVCRLGHALSANSDNSGSSTAFFISTPPVPSVSSFSRLRRRARHAHSLPIL